MDKKIKLIMDENKDIIININDIEKIKIEFNSRSIKADDIFNLLNYNKGDTYTYEILNENNYDAPVIEFFKNLLYEITSKLENNDGTDQIEMPYNQDDIPF